MVATEVRAPVRLVRWFDAGNDRGDVKSGLDALIKEFAGGGSASALAYAAGAPSEAYRGFDIPGERFPAFEKSLTTLLERPDGAFRIGVDVALTAAGSADRLHRTPAPQAADRLAAEALIGADAMRAFAGAGGRVVNVVIADDGLDGDYLATLPGAPAVHGVIGPAGPARRGRRRANRGHAGMIARNVLSLAPQARLWDMNLLPDVIDDIGVFTSDALPRFLDLQAQMAAAPEEAWVIVCAWGLLSRDFEVGSFSYSDDARHPLCFKIRQLVDAGADVVFAAGNNGQFAPDPRSGFQDRGPERSIFGCNGLPSVLTVGAVTVRGDWIGASSQGPEPKGLRFFEDAKAHGPGPSPVRKPDLCAPSWFAERGDRHAVVTGSSGACGLAAGVVAAARRRIGRDLLAPRDLIHQLRQTARPQGHAGGDARDAPASRRQGAGVIDCAALAESLTHIEARDGEPRTSCLTQVAAVLSRAFRGARPGASASP